MTKPCGDILAHSGGWVILIRKSDGGLIASFQVIDKLCRKALERKIILYYNETIENTEIKVKRSKWVEKQETIPIKSDGSSSSYYDLKLSDLTLDFIEGTNKIKTEHLIRDVFDNDFDFGNMFKSLVRAYGTTQGAGKEGNDISYEMNKIIYSANKIKDYYAKVGS